MAKFTVETTADRLSCHNEKGEALLLFPLHLLDDFCVSVARQIKNSMMPLCGQCGCPWYDHHDKRCEGGAGFQDFCSCTRYTTDDPGKYPR